MHIRYIITTTFYLLLLLVVGLTCIVRDKLPTQETNVQQLFWSGWDITKGFHHAPNLQSNYNFLQRKKTLIDLACFFKFFFFLVVYK